jgi:hypothetical protein
VGIACVVSAVVSVCIVADWAWFRIEATSHGRWAIAGATALSQAANVMVGFKWWEPYRSHVAGELPRWRVSLSRWMTARPSRGLLSILLAIALPTAAVGVTRLPHRLQYYWVEASDDGCSIKQADGSSKALVPSMEVNETDHVSCTRSIGVSFRQETAVPMWVAPDGGTLEDAGKPAPPIVPAVVHADVPDASPESTKEAGTTPKPDRPRINVPVHPAGPSLHPEAGLAPAPVPPEDTPPVPRPPTTATCAQQLGTCITNCTGDYTSNEHIACVHACNTTFAGCSSPAAPSP